IAGHAVTFRAGGSYDESAVANEYVSLTSLDFDKMYVGGGLGIRVSDKLRFDLLYGHFFTKPITVDPDKAKVTRVNPLAGEGANTETINGGRYEATANLFGLGSELKF
ncbi:MAG: outer membrane protein transport protein, partial [Polyangiaceae bacterium]